MKYSIQVPRAVFILIGITAIFVYLLLCILTGLNWKQEMGMRETFWLKANYLLDWFFFIPSISLMLLAQYLLVYIKDIFVNSIGLMVLLVLVLGHFWIEIGAAHAGANFSLFIHLSEMLVHTIIFFLFWYFIKRKKYSSLVIQKS